MTPSFDNSYARLPERFFAKAMPAQFPAPALIRLNRALADELGLDPDWLAGPEGLAMLSGQAIAPGSEPIALAYAPISIVTRTELPVLACGTFKLSRIFEAPSRRSPCYGARLVRPTAFRRSHDELPLRHILAPRRTRASAPT